MIKFFRKIRQKLLSESKFSKYLIYAIGEIILVVFGILIALQINNWNESRKNKIQETNIIANLHEGLIETRNALKIEKKNIINSLNAGKLLMNLLENDSKFNEKQIDSLIYNLFPTIHFSVQVNTIDKLTQSGELNLINNDSIKSLLIDWNTIQKKLLNREEFLKDWAKDEVLPYLANHISFKQIDIFGGFAWSGKSTLDKNYEYILNDLRFENLLSNLVFGYNQKLYHLEEADNFLSHLMVITKNYPNLQN